MNTKAIIFLCIIYAVCTQTKTQALAKTTLPTTETTPVVTTPAPTTVNTPTIATIPGSEASNSNKSSDSDVTSTSDNKPVLTNTEYHDHLLELAKKGLAKFTLEFQKCALNFTGTSKNILFSPVNVAGILATLLLGAEGETKREILTAVGISTGEDLNHKEDKIHAALSTLFDNFTEEAHANPATTVEIAQSIFLQNGIPVTDFFKNLSQTVYKNEIIEVDFSSPTVEAANIINKWIDNKTHHRIEKLVDPPLAKTTKMILSNTLFFNGEWEFPFLNETAWKPFQTESGKYTVKMMCNVGEAYLLREMGRNYSALGLPYKGGNIIMYFVVPKNGHTLKDILHDLTIEDLNDIATKSRKVEDISYEVPFMKINDNIQLNNILQTIGIKSVFSETHANLSNIAEDVFVSQIVHKANLDVTEAGSTGSASTIVQIENKFQKEPFFVNQPFICYVHHRSSNLISFWATVHLPVPNKLS